MPLLRLSPALAAFVALSALGCVAPPPPATVQQLMQRASYDLQCPQGYMGLYPIDSLTKIVSGCGKHLVYQEHCHSSAAGAACTWRLEPSAPAVSPVAVTPVPAAPIAQGALAPTPQAAPPSPITWPVPSAAPPVPSAPPPAQPRPKSPSEYLPRDL